MQSQASSSSSSVGSREITERLQASAQNLNRGQDAKEKELKIETVAASVQPSADFKEGLMLGSQEVISYDQDPTIDKDIFNDIAFDWNEYVDPVVVETGQTYSRKQIENHFAIGKKHDPLTNVEFKNFDLIPNISFNLYLQEYKCREALFKAKKMSYKDYQLCMPHSLMSIKKPVIAADGFTYEEETIKAHLAKGNNTSPITGQKLPHTRLVVNEKIKSCIENYEQKRTIIHRKELSDQDLQLAIQLDRRYLQEDRETGMAITEATRRQTENLTRHLRELETEYARRESLYQGGERNSKQVIDRLTLQLHQQQHDYKQHEEKLIKDIQSKQQRIDQLQLVAGNAVSVQVEGAPAGDKELKEAEEQILALKTKLQMEKNSYARTIADLRLDIQRLQNELKPINRKDNGKPSASSFSSPTLAQLHLQHLEDKKAWDQSDQERKNFWEEIQGKQHTLEMLRAQNYRGIANLIQRPHNELPVSPSPSVPQPSSANAQAVSQPSPHISSQPSPKPPIAFSLGAGTDAKSALGRENKQVSSKDEIYVLEYIKDYNGEIDIEDDEFTDTKKLYKRLNDKLIHIVDPYQKLLIIASRRKQTLIDEKDNEVFISEVSAIEHILRDQNQLIFYDILDRSLQALITQQPENDRLLRLSSELKKRKLEDVKTISQIKSPWMQFRIGSFYENGLSFIIAKDDNKAYEWYEKSAAQGYAEALQKIADRPGNKGQRLQG